MLDCKQMQNQMQEAGMTHGKSIGGHTRAARLSAEERSMIARRAALKRWSQDLPEAICGSADRPLRIGDVALQVLRACGRDKAGAVSTSCFRGSRRTSATRVSENISGPWSRS